MPWMASTRAWRTGSRVSAATVAVAVTRISATTVR